MYFSSWFLLDQKGTAAILLFACFLIGWIIWHRTDQLVFGVIASGVLLLSLWRVFIPLHFEINADGIVCWAIGQKKFIAWSDIKVYQIRSNGILMLPQHDRFVLEPFRSVYLPVPPSLMAEVLYRFRVFVDRISD